MAVYGKRLAASREQSTARGSCKRYRLLSAELGERGLPVLREHHFDALLQEVVHPLVVVERHLLQPLGGCARHVDGQLLDLIDFRHCSEAERLGLGRVSPDMASSSDTGFFFMARFPLDPDQHPLHTGREPLRRPSLLDLVR